MYILIDINSCRHTLKRKPIHNTHMANTQW